MSQTETGRPLRQSERIQRFADRLSLGHAVGIVILVAVGLTGLGAVLLRLVNPGALHTGGEALWLSVTTVTTVGFGDVVPTNSAGRFITALLALLGVSLIPALTSIVVSIMLNKRRREEERARADDRRELLAAIQGVDRRLQVLERGRGGGDGG